MKKTLIFSSIVLASILNARAENRLFATDILHQGESDAFVSVDHYRESYDIHSPGTAGTSSVATTSESFQVRYGLGSDWHVGALLNYASQGVVKTDYSTPPAHLESKFDGRRNPTLLASYGFMNDDNTPFSLKGELRVNLNTTGTPSIYQGLMSAGWRSSDTLKLYGTYAASTNRSANIPSTSSITFGAFEDVSEDVTLIPYVAYARSRAINTVSSSAQTVIGLGSTIQFTRNAYVLTDISLFRDSAVSYGSSRQDATNDGRHIGVSLYCLFK